jgi:Flp pilus assembly protein CpaB
MSRLRVLLIIALLVVILGVVAALVIPNLTQQNNQSAAATSAAAGTPVVQQGANNNNAQLATNTPPPTALPTISIVVAVQNINRGQVITPDVVDFREWPAVYAPQTAVTSFEDAVGKIARVDIFREQPILFSLVTDNLNDLGAVGSDAGALLPQGRRLVAVPIDRLTSIGYALQAGDRVDLIVSFLFVDIDPEFQSLTPNEIALLSVTVDDLGSRQIQPVLAYSGRVENRNFPPPLGAVGSITVPSESQRPRLVTQMTIQDALVLHVGTFPADGRLFRRPTPQPVATLETAATPAPVQAAGGTPVAPTATPVPPDIVAIAVSPQEAVVLTFFIESRFPITFALRPANEIGIQNVAQVNLEYVLSQYRISLPRRLDYSVEPAIRSIRQLYVGDQIRLNPEPVAVTTATP